MAAEIRPIMVEGDRLRVFATNARCLSQDEISTLPLDARSSAEALGLGGTWLEVQCPEEACITGRDTITLSVKGAGKREEAGIWLRLFCPDKSCVITEPSNLP